MIKKLKRRFILLAMASLVTLLAVIVAGMNIINYNSVVSNADETLEALSVNRGRLPILFGDGLDDMIDELYGGGWSYRDETGSSSGFYFSGRLSGSVADEEPDDIEDYDSDDSDDTDDNESGISSGGKSAASARGMNGGPGSFDSRGGSAPAWMSRDEAEETRFFTALLDSNGNVISVNTDRIYAVDDDTAAEYAAQAAKAYAKNSGSSSDDGLHGFIDEYRYAVCSEGSYTRVTFLDCGRTLEAFRTFLYGSIIMSLIGLALMFLIICYFAGRIVKPVAESYDKQKRFITDAGHEIKTPLTIIKANIDVMKMDIEDAVDQETGISAEDPDNDNNNEEHSSCRENEPVVSSLAGSLYESLDDISGQVDRLTNLTNDLVYLSRMEEAGGTLTMTEVPVSDIVRETAEPFEAVARERSKELEIEVEPMLSMQGSTKELEKLVSILVENALKYSPEGDRIGVSLKREGRSVVLEVRNKAVTPLSDEDLEHVFERFYRTDKSRNSAAGGHGIGLSMASAIVSAHGGKIRARSGDGTEFIVTATMPAA